MEKNEPSLIPEWLKTSGSSSVRSDDRGPSRLTRNRSVNTTTNNNRNLGNTNGRNLGRSFSSDRTTSSYFLRSSSSNGSGNVRSPSSYGSRNHHDREWNSSRNESNSKEKSFLGERWRRDSPDSPKRTSHIDADRDGLRRSQSMISGKRGDKWHRKATNDSDYYGGKSKNASPTKSSPIGGPKMNFARDFPSLGSEERTAAASDVIRVPSPGFSSSSIQSLPIGISSNVGSEKWKSALAEVPGLVASNGMGASSLGTNTGLNMAEAVAQGPIVSQANPQSSVGTQISGELSLKQSKQLIPVTPSLPKSLTKVGQHQHLGPSLLANTPRGGPVKGEVAKPKLHILKPAREKNAVAPILKDKLSPTGSSKPLTPTLSHRSSSVSEPTPFHTPSSNSITDPKMTVLEKRPTSQARSRNDFFNSVRKKSMENTANSSSALETSSNIAAESPSSLSGSTDSLPNHSIAALNPSLSIDHVSEAKVDSNCNGNSNEHLGNGIEKSISDLSVPDEAEAAFLRSLGWEEDSDEGGLTEEEISAFFRDAAKYIDSKPTLKALQDLQIGNTAES